jgi:hypothetical protein
LKRNKRTDKRESWNFRDVSRTKRNQCREE